VKDGHAPRRLSTATAIASACLALALAAPPLASATASRDEYAQQADPACQLSNQFWKRKWGQFTRADRHLKFHAAGNALAAIGTNIASTTATLRTIAPPPGDEARISQWLGMWDQIAHIRNPQAASAYRLGKFKRLGNLFGQSDALVRGASDLMFDYPFRQCA